RIRSPCPYPTTPHACAWRSNSPSTALVRKSASVPALLLPGSLHDRTPSPRCWPFSASGGVSLPCRALGAALLRGRPGVVGKGQRHHDVHRRRGPAGSLDRPVLRVGRGRAVAGRAV